MAAMIGLLIILGAGCGQASDSGIALSKPRYVGKTEKGKPEFRLKWNRYPDAGGYEIAIYAEGEDPFGRGPFAIRSVKNIYQNKTSGSLIFLRGVHTDTVTYRVKVRPIVAVDSLKDSSNDIWSNIWEIRFVGGEYEVAATENDFDEAYGQEGSGNQTGNSASEGSDLSSENSVEAGESDISQKGAQTQDDQNNPAFRHVFPESLTEYLAKEAEKAKGLEISGIRSLITGVDDTTYGEPRQNAITDKEVIRLFSEALSGIQVSEKVDDITDNKTTFYYSALDAEGKEILQFSICDGMLVGKDGRYSLIGLDALTNVKGIISAEGWTNFLKDQAAKADNYDEKKNIVEFHYTQRVFTRSEGTPDLIAELTNTMRKSRKEAIKEIKVLMRLMEPLRPTIRDIIYYPDGSVAYTYDIKYNDLYYNN